MQSPVSLKQKHVTLSLTTKQAEFLLTLVIRQRAWEQNASKTRILKAIRDCIIIALEPQIRTYFVKVK